MTHTSSVRFPKPGTSAVACELLKVKSLTLNKPSEAAWVTTTPSKSARSPVTRSVNGAGEAAPGVSLNERMPHPSMVCPVVV